jgi:hypothetical protein
MEVFYVVQQLLQCHSHDSDTRDCKLGHINLSRGREGEVTSDRRHCVSLLLASVLLILLSFMNAWVVLLLTSPRDGTAALKDSTNHRGILRQLGPATFQLC